MLYFTKQIGKLASKTYCTCYERLLAKDTENNTVHYKRIKFEFSKQTSQQLGLALCHDCNGLLVCSNEHQELLKPQIRSGI